MERREHIEAGGVRNGELRNSRHQSPTDSEDIQDHSGGENGPRQVGAGEPQGGRWPTTGSIEGRSAGPYKRECRSCPSTHCPRTLVAQQAAGRSRSTQRAAARSSWGHLDFHICYLEARLSPADGEHGRVRSLCCGIKAKGGQKRRRGIMFFSGKTAERAAEKQALKITKRQKAGCKRL